jgi:hypothetical protein
MNSSTWALDPRLAPGSIAVALEEVEIMAAMFDARELSCHGIGSMLLGSAVGRIDSGRCQLVRLFRTLFRLLARPVGLQTERRAAA